MHILSASFFFFFLWCYDHPRSAFGGQCFISWEGEGRGGIVKVSCQHLEFFTGRNMFMLMISSSLWDSFCLLNCFYTFVLQLLICNSKFTVYATLHICVYTISFLLFLSLKPDCPGLRSFNIPWVSCGVSSPHSGVPLLIIPSLSLCHTHCSYFSRLFMPYQNCISLYYITLEP